MTESAALRAELSGEPTARGETAIRNEWIARCGTAYPKVYRGLIAMGAGPDDAADALQDAFERALTQRQPSGPAEGWLFIVARRRWKRLRWRQRIFHPLEFVGRDHARLDREGEIDLLVELERLTERQRTVLVARHTLGLSQKETADLLGIAPGTVGAIGYQAIQILRERLGG